MLASKYSSNKVDTVELYRDDSSDLPTVHRRAGQRSCFQSLSKFHYLFMICCVAFAVAGAGLFAYRITHPVKYVVERQVEYITNTPPHSNEDNGGHNPKNSGTTAPTPIVEEGKSDHNVSNVVENQLSTILQCSGIADIQKMDCLPDSKGGATINMCLARGCCWATPSVAEAPACFFPNDYNGYKVESIDRKLNKIYVTLQRQTSSGFANDVQTLILLIDFIDETQVRLKFFDPLKPRYEPPVPKLNINERNRNETITPLYDVNVGKEGILYITRASTKVQIFSVDLKRIVFADQFLQITSFLPTEYIYGIGEHKDSFKRNINWRTYTLFNQDVAPQFSSTMNLYGSHTFYLSLDDTLGNSNGVFLLNSNAIDILLQPAPAITYRAIGGILDFFIFLGPQPGDVVRQYVSLIGKPELPPFWGLGFHLCRYGYKTLDNTKKTMQRNIDAGIPLDTQWNDIDYMDSFKDFTFDNNNFKGLPDFVKSLHDEGRHYVQIVDPGISSVETPGSYPPFDDGVAMDIFVKNTSNQLFVGKVWTGKDTVYPDFTHPNASAYWTKQLAAYHKQVPIDGMWIDMNEPSNFLDGQVNGCPESRYEDPQYVPGTRPLRHKTVCMTAKQYFGLHYDVHNLYGFTEAIASNVALKAVRQKRPFIISRSTFAGHGHYAGHWDGDIFSTWDALRWTIPSILNFNMFGVPLIGADICGFNGNTTSELCARWSALGAFYPFSRNHNDESAKDQDPAALGPTVVSAAKKALNTRYSLLPYMYTQFYRSHLFGDTVVRALLFEFPKDVNTYHIDTQFLWGSAVMVVPTLQETATTVDAYIPETRWYMDDNLDILDGKGQSQNFPSPPDSIHVFYRGGSIIPRLPPKNTTTQLREGNFYLQVLLDDSKKASGELYWDDGDSLDTVKQGNYSHVEFSSSDNKVVSKIIKSGYEEAGNYLSKVIVAGVDKKPSQVTFNGKAVKYEYSQQILTVSDISVSLFNTSFVMSWQ